jgi:hypothetical protein
VVLLPDYLWDRAKQWIQRADKTRSTAIAETLADRAKLLTRAAIDAERSLGLKDEFQDPRMRVIASTARTIQQLRRDLEYLPARMSLHLKCKNFVAFFSSADQRKDAWRAANRLAEEFGCEAEFRPDGCIWFIKSPRKGGGA